LVEIQLGLTQQLESHERGYVAVGGHASIKGKHVTFWCSQPRPEAVYREVLNALVQAQETVSVSSTDGIACGTARWKPFGDAIVEYCNGVLANPRAAKLARDWRSGTAACGGLSKAVVACAVHVDDPAGGPFDTKLAPISMSSPAKNHFTYSSPFDGPGDLWKVAFERAASGWRVRSVTIEQVSPDAGE
jgi:hypothetical protein